MSAFKPTRREIEAVRRAALVAELSERFARELPFHVAYRAPAFRAQAARASARAFDLAAAIRDRGA
jgi:hypothetical protein